MIKKINRRKERIKVLGVEPAINVSIKVVGLEGAEVKEIKIKPKKRKRAKKREEFELPRISIGLIPPLDRIPHREDLLTDPYYPRNAEKFVKIYITRDKRYLVHDPRVSKEELAFMNELVTKLFFLTDSDTLMEAVSDENALRALLAESGASDKIIYLIRREIFGYGILDPLVHDPNLQDIQVPGPDVYVKVVHKDYGELITNIKFDEETLDSYIEKMIIRANRTISLFTPLASVQIPEGHRLTVTYKREVSTRGSSIVIRKFPEKPWSITRLLRFRSISPEMAAWLMLLVENKKGIIVAGVMGSGKTSITNALCNFIPQYATIVTIEDTPELKLAHPYWIQHKTRESLTIDGTGSIGMFDLVKHALRESADYIIIGEVRGEEGKVWAQAIATGHGGITTFHAESPQAVLARLTSPPINVERGLLTALKTIVMARRYVVREETEAGVIFKPIRKVAEIYDIVVEKDRERLVRLFQYDLANDEFMLENSIEDSNTAKLIMTERGWDRATFLEEYELRVKLLRRLQEHVLKYDATPLLEFHEASKVFWLFSENPDKAFNYIDEIEHSLENSGKIVEDNNVRGSVEYIAGSHRYSRSTSSRSIGEPSRRRRSKIRIISETKRDEEK